MLTWRPLMAVRLMMGRRKPEPEQALAHGGDALVEDAKHAEALLGLPYAHC